MKLFILKLLSLFVLCLGLISLAYAIGFAPVTDYLAQTPEKVAELKNLLPEPLAFLQDALDVKVLWLIGSMAAVVFGCYGFFPRLSKWKKPKKIAYDGPHGQVQIQLDTVERSLNSVISRMPEVKKIDVVVEPREGGRSALIKATAVLQHQPGQNARAIAGLVSDYIAETATKMLGLEELATIELNVTAINVNSRKSSKQIRKESLSHSGNAPVELLEASPKPMSLASTPDQPLGSGPIEEEMEDEDGGGAAEHHGSAMEANAVDSKEEESKQAAARSELLEPLNLHGADSPAEQESPADSDKTAESYTGASEEPDYSESNREADPEDVPDIVSHSRDGRDAQASVVPEPLGDMEESGTDDDGPSDTAESDNDDSGTEAPDGNIETDVEVPDEEIPEAVEEGRDDDFRSPWASMDNTGTVGFEGDRISTDDKASDGTESDAPSVDAADVSDDAEEEGDDASNLMESATTDSIVGDLDDADEVEETGATDEAFTTESAEKGDEDEESDQGKKGWGWFN